MTLLAAILTTNAVYLGADSSSILLDEAHQKGVRESIEKFHQVSDALMWGAQGNMATAVRFGKWLTEQSWESKSWEQLARQAEDELHRIDDRERELSSKSEPRLSEVIVGGNLGGRLDFVSIPPDGVASIASDYRAAPDDDVTCFLGTGSLNVDAAICWNVAHRLSPYDSFDSTLFGRFFDAYVEYDARLGGPARLWRITVDDGIRQVWPKGSSAFGGVGHSEVGGASQSASDESQRR